MNSVDEKRLFVTIKGNRLLWESFIRQLDLYQCKISGSRKFEEQYCKLKFPLQILTEEWHEGADRISEHIMPRILEKGYNEPEEKRLPEAIDELYCEMEKRLGISLHELLEGCMKASARQYGDYLAKQEKEANRRQKVKDLVESVRKTETDLTLDDVIFLYQLQRAKEDDEEYNAKEKERIATRLLVNLILQGTISDNATCWMLKSLVSNDFVDESDIDALLEKKGDKRDCEWYLEDMIGWDEEDETKFTVSELLETGMDKLLETIGISEIQLHSREVNAI